MVNIIPYMEHLGYEWSVCWDETTYFCDHGVCSGFFQNALRKEPFFRMNVV